MGAQLEQWLFEPGAGRFVAASIEVFVLYGVVMFLQRRSGLRSDRRQAPEGAL